ncbi:ferrochelatase [Anaplasma centrale str. Israel]|uniref:Ferrochelatase n=1 Tax=Anaplasma centrale (strain Israel) TaxID=574556 RepID=D1AU18_ANACI|nr:ferrochelatase [Anaplasma centrale]ACZ49046.1 ferrochelatase [Anaplasma centrale str. Israel]
MLVDSTNEMQDKKVAVVLLNLGGPGSLCEVEKFLFSLFSDRRILGLPYPLRMLVAMIISKLRARSARKIYSLMGGKSTILEETEHQASALEKRLNSAAEGKMYKVFVCMRHSKPRSREALHAVRDYQPEHVVLLPMYPQYSSTTTLSAIEDWYNSARRARYKPDTRVICCYHVHEDYILAHRNLILSEYNKALMAHDRPRVLFSAHGLPVRVVERGDPYQEQIRQSVCAIVEQLGIQALDYSICYQSKVGPTKWLEPSTKLEILRARDDGVPVIVVPISFVSEHSETLVELDMEYKALMPGEQKYFRVPALGVDASFIECLYKLSRAPDTSMGSCCGKHGLCWKRARSAIHAAVH